MRRHILGLLVGALALLGTTSTAKADFNHGTYAWSGNGGTGSVDFLRSGGNLIITLTYDTMPAGGLSNSNLLGGLFFNFTGASSLNGTSGGGASAFSGLAIGAPAIFENTGDVHYNPPDHSYQTNGAGQINLSGEWAALATVHGFNYGLASVGYGGTFGNGNLIDSNPLLQYSHSSPPDGADYQLGASSFSYANYGPNDLDHLINTSVIFTLGNLSADADLGNINGQVQFGTGFEEPNVPFGPMVPAPAGVILLGMGGALTGLVTWLKRRQPKVA